MTGYSDDLAYVHDVGFSGYAVDAGPGLLSILRTSGIENGLVVDLGCGSGIWAARLTGEGYRVLGIDISPSMIRLARRNAPGANFRAGSLLTCGIPHCDAITSLGECVNYCFEPGNSVRRMDAFFRRVYAALRPGGIFIFDFAEPGQVAPGGVRHGQLLRNDWAILFAIEEDHKRGMLTRRITTFRKSGKSNWRRTDETHMQRLYRAAELTPKLRAAGFRVRVVRSFGSLQLPPAHSAIVAVKR
jgi:SAM-dependent methyltransferase